MCLYTEQEEPIKLTEDLKVYKWVGRIEHKDNDELKCYSIFLIIITRIYTNYNILIYYHLKIVLITLM
jgi:hypothetical protein